MKRSSAYSLIEVLLAAAAMAALILADPFGYHQVLLAALKTAFPALTREPKLLYFVYAHVAGICAKAGMLAIAVAVTAARGTTRDTFGARAPRRIPWLHYIAVFAAASLAVRWYQASNPLLPSLPAQAVFSYAAPVVTFVMIASILFAAPVIEELLFRGYFFGTLRKSFGAPASIITTAAFFACMHVSAFDAGFTYVLFIFGFGIVFGYLRERTGSVIAPIVFHWLHNLIYLAYSFIAFKVLGY